MELPENCIANILSHTTPADACRLSVVSRLFHSAAESDAVWCRFLPSDVVSIISQSDSQSSLLANSPSKKSLYLALSQHPFIMEEGKKSFQLDKQSGKKCYMLAARALTIVWGDTPQYWNWITLPKSRFPEVAQLLGMWWIEIHGAVSTLSLSPNTQYAAYLVFSVVGVYGFQNLDLSPSTVFAPDLEFNIRYYGYGFDNCSVELSVGTLGGETRAKIVSLCPDPHNRLVGLESPIRRSDGWFEIEMGLFFNSGLEDEKVYMSVMEIEAGIEKRGLIIEGIEVRPKEEN